MTNGYSFRQSSFYKCLVLIFLIGGTSVSLAESPAEKKVPSIKKLISPGNLASSTSLGCIKLDEAKKHYTPADLYPAVAACIKADRHQKAFELFSLAGVFGAFDRQRVADRSAHQGLRVLIIRNLTRLPAAKRSKFSTVLNTWQKKFKSPEYQKLCERVRDLGPPDYHPSYLIQHGIQAFIKNKNKNPLIEPFDKKAAWQKALVQYMHCGK